MNISFSISFFTSFSDNYKNKKRELNLVEVLRTKSGIIIIPLFIVIVFSLEIVPVFPQRSALFLLHRLEAQTEEVLRTAVSTAAQPLMTVIRKLIFDIKSINKKDQNKGLS